MNFKKALSLTFLMLLICVSRAQENTEEQLQKKFDERPYPQWFKDAKLGIFIHWGVYSVPSFCGREQYAEWFLRGLQTDDTLRQNFLRRTYGEHATYRDLAPLFKAELFNPDEWAEFFKKAGAKYVVLVSKHHDGYALWPSKFSRNWNSVDIGPKRDLVGELTKSVRNTGLKMGLYYSLTEWNHPLHRWYTDPHDSIASYVENYMVPQFKELINAYRPSVVFSDGDWSNSAKQLHSAELIDWYYSFVGDDAIVNNRWGGGLKTGFLTPEYSAGIKETDRPWAEVRGLGRSFGLNRNETLEAYGTSKALIHRFVQTVANGGGMIINVGPKADGQIPLIQQERLIQLGNWLKINGEAIYGAEPYGSKEEEKEVSFERVDKNIDFNWVRNSPMESVKEDDFSAEWNGFIVAPTSGNYTLKVKADDAAEVYIDNQLVINQNYTAQGSQSEVMGAKTTASTNGNFKMKAGKGYPVKIRYQEKKQNASVKLYWISKNKSEEIVPETAFFQDEAQTIPGLKAIYTSMQTYLCYTQNKGKIYAISFDWPEEELILNIENPDANASVKLLGLDKKLPWVYKNGNLHIDTSGITYQDMPSHDAWTFEINKN